MDVSRFAASTRKLGHYYLPIVRHDSIVFHYCGLDGVAAKLSFIFAEPEMVDGTTRGGAAAAAFKAFSASYHHRPAGRRQALRSVRSDFAQPVCACAGSDRGLGSRSTSFTPATIFHGMVETSKADFHALQIPEAKERVIAAGIPWFATMFARDSIIAAYQSLMLNSRLVAETLRVLASHQGKEKKTGATMSPGEVASQIVNRGQRLSPAASFLFTDINAGSAGLFVAPVFSPCP